MILMLLWARKEATKHMVRVHADGTEQYFVSFGNDTVSIHYGDLYSAPSRLLLRSAPDPCTAKKKSFETRVECVRKTPGEQSLRQRKPIPHRGTNHRECTGLGCGCTSKRNKE